MTLSDNLNEFMMNFTDIAREALFAFLCFACFVTNITVVGVDEFNDAGRLLVFYSVWIKIDLRTRSENTFGFSIGKRRRQPASSHESSDSMNMTENQALIIPIAFIQITHHRPYNSLIFFQYGPGQRGKVHPAVRGPIAVATVIVVVHSEPDLASSQTGEPERGELQP